MEYNEKLNLYLCYTMDEILDVLLDSCYSKIFKDELQSFLSSNEACFSFVGDVRSDDPSTQGVFIAKANSGQEEAIIYVESIARSSDIYHSLKRGKAKDLAGAFQPFMEFIKTNFA